MRKGFSRLGRFTPTPPSPTFARLRIAKAILYGKRANVAYNSDYVPLGVDRQSINCRKTPVAKSLIEKHHTASTGIFSHFVTAALSLR